MFKTNQKHNQISLWGIQNTLPDKIKKKLLNSQYYFFYEIIFRNINENDFKVLYSEKASRPNAPINCMVAALILKQKCNWSYEELFEQMEFSLLTKTALGLDSIDELPFDDATIFNFQNRIKDYHIATGINLFERVFDKLTEEQIKQLKLKTNIQRIDSLQACSNIREYSRLQLLIEVLLRLWRVLTETDKEHLEQMFSMYTKKSSGQYIYKLKSSEIPHELEKLVVIYHYCHSEIISHYKTQEIFKIFERVYTEHFTELTDKIVLKHPAELSSSCLQSPDDVEATYREKRSEEYKGYVINAAETASQENELNLITDVAVRGNNIDDSKVLNERIDRIYEKTSDLAELHSDGAYGSAENDKKLSELSILQVQTAVKGRHKEVDIVIERTSVGNYEVKCPNQSVLSISTSKRNKAEFDKEKCKNCEYSSKCPAIEMKSNRTYYFTEEDYLRYQRISNILKIPQERRKIRSNVEATMHEFSCRLVNGKMKVRGFFKATLFAFTTAIAINFGRIYRYSH
jgi:hypothetical protein